MHNQIGFLIDLSDRNCFNFYKATFLDFSNKLTSIKIIDVSKILKKKSYLTFVKEKFSIPVLRPKNIREFKKILNLKQLILMYCINLNFKYFLIHFLVARSNIKKFIISNIGYNPENFNYFNKNFLQKVRIFFKLRAVYYFFRLLILISIFPKIDYFFESSSYIINSINNGLSKKIKRIFPYFNFSFYKKVIQINSKHYNPVLKTKISEDYIVFVDGMTLDHNDVIFREGKPDPKKRLEYYRNLNKVLGTLERIYKKKVIICLHPKNDISIRNNDFLKFKCVKFKTEEYINKAFIVLFHESSSIVQAILLKKKIISLQGNILGDYLSRRCLLYSSTLGLEKIMLDNGNFLKYNKISIKVLNQVAKNNYNKYIKENLVQDISVTGIDQVINYVRKL